MLIIDELDCPDAPKRSGRAAPQGATAFGLAELALRKVPKEPLDVFKNEVKTSASFSNQFAPQGANLALCRPGGSGGVAAPVPIPNTAVKRPSADGTSS